MICPLMSKPIVTTNAGTGFEQTEYVYMNCEKENCAWWVKETMTKRDPAYLDGRTKEVYYGKGNCVIKLLALKGKEARR